MAITTLANALFEIGIDVEILCTYNFGFPAYTLNPQIHINYLTRMLPNREAFISAKRSHNVFKIFKEGIYALKVLYVKKKTMKNAIKNISTGTVISSRNEHSVLLSKYGQENVKKIAQLHSDHRFEKKLIHCFRTKYQNIDFFVLLTPKTQQEVESFLDGFNDHTKCVTIPNFVEEVHIQDLIKKERQVIAAGRLHPDKDFASLLRIFTIVNKKKPEFVLKIAGEGPLLEELRVQAVQLGISDSVQFLGALPHEKLLLEMAKSYCYALTSVEESFGLVLVESMMCGTVPVAFDVRVGPEAIVDDGENGFLIPDRDESVFAEKVIKLIDDNALRVQLEVGAKKKAECFYKDRVLPKWIEVFNA